MVAVAILRNMQLVIIWTICFYSFSESTTVWYVKPFVKALLNQSDINVIIVDWKEAARFPYNQAVGNSRIVGNKNL